MARVLAEGSADLRHRFGIEWRDVGSHREGSADVRVIVADRQRRVEAAGSVWRARLDVPAVAGGADERGISETP
jgi:hypothetical protein